jgi:small subunit ribosomal protein S16
MVKIRLKRVGKTKQPSYRVVVADARSPRDGRNIEAIGHYQPRRDPSEIVIDNERAVFWLRRGAQPSEPVKKLLRISGAWAEFTGEASPQPGSAAPQRATRAASVTVAEGEEPPAVLPEAVDQSGAAPDATVEGTEDGG